MSKRKNWINGQFIAHRLDMLASPAYRELSLSAHRVMTRIEIEHMNHGGKENGKLPVTYDHFHEAGIHRHAIGPAIRELVALGFLEITQKGRPSAGEMRWPNLFRLTYLRTPSKGILIDWTDEWALIKTKEQAALIAKRARITAPKRRCKSIPPVTKTITS